MLISRISQGCPSRSFLRLFLSLVYYVLNTNKLILKQVGIHVCFNYDAFFQSIFLCSFIFSRETFSTSKARQGQCGICIFSTSRYWRSIYVGEQYISAYLPKIKCRIVENYGCSTQL